MSITLEQLGITAEELQDRIVNAACDRLLENVDFDEDGDEWRQRSPLAKKLDAAIKQRIDDTVAALADKHVLPNVSEYVENLTLQATNEWGEAKGEKLTFVEYLVHRAEAYLSEPVDYNGEPKKKDSYGWNARSTRIAHMIDKHLDYAVASAMKQAVTNANASIIGGLEQAVKIALAEVGEKLKVDVKTG